MDKVDNSPLCSELSTNACIRFSHSPYDYGSGHHLGRTTEIIERRWTSR